MRFAPCLILLFCLPALAHAGVSARALAPLLAPATDPHGPGCVLSVTRGGHTVLAQAWGRANLEQPAPNRLDTVFEAGSVSKQFTAAAVAALVTQGVLSLDEDVRRFLPELPDYGVAITPRHLLTHTSGLRNWDDLAALSGRPRDAGGGITQREALGYVVRQSALNFAPGSQYLYSNSNYVLAAVLVERASGQSLQAYSARTLFGPAGMTATQWREDHTRVVARRSTAYTPGDDGRLHIDMPGEDVVGPGGLLTTVGDLQRWNALLDHPPAAAQAWVALRPGTRGRLADGTATAYGLGLEYEVLQHQDVISHAGATAGYHTYLARVPAQSLSLALLCNAGAVNTEEQGPKLLSRFLPEETSAPAPAMADAQVDASLAGRYWNPASRAVATVTVDREGAHVNGGIAFRASGADTLRSSDGTRTLRVQRSADGLVALTVGRSGNSPVTLRPAPPWTPGPDRRRTYAGAYRGRDIDATWTVDDDGTQLRVSGPGAQSFLLDPLYADTFSARDAGWVIAFERGDGDGREMRFYTTRTWGVAFARVPATAAPPR